MEFWKCSILPNCASVVRFWGLEPSQRTLFQKVPPLPELEPLVFCFVFCLDSFIQGKICLAAVGELSKGLLAALAGVGLLLAF